MQSTFFMICILHLILLGHLVRQLYVTTCSDMSIRHALLLLAAPLVCILMCRDWSSYSLSSNISSQSVPQNLGTHCLMKVQVVSNELEINKNVTVASIIQNSWWKWWWRHSFLTCGVLVSCGIAVYTPSIADFEHSHKFNWNDSGKPLCLIFSDNDLHDAPDQCDGHVMWPLCFIASCQ